MGGWGGPLSQIHLATNSQDCTHWVIQTTHICDLISGLRVLPLRGRLSKWQGTTLLGPESACGRGAGGVAGLAHPEVSGSRGVNVDLALPVAAPTPAGHFYHQVLEGPSFAQRQLQNSLESGSVGPVQPVSHRDHQPGTIQVQGSCKK